MLPANGHDDNAAALSPVKRALLEIRELRARLAASERQSSPEPVAIIGIGLRLPGGIVTPEAFWELLANGRDAISEIPADRWDVEEFYSADPEQRGHMNTRHGAFLEKPDQFDADFFGVSPREAASMDPQHRLLLETAWHALEDAALAPDRLAGSRTGVFLGFTNSDYARHLLTDARSIDTYTSLGSAWSIAAGRLSYLLDLRGPSLVVDTACSSSLMAVHLACQSLRQGECATALAGAANLILSPELCVALAKTRILSPDGQCHTFAAKANGFVRGEGCAVVVLKPFWAAQRDQDRILGVIRGSAANQDGRSAGLTAPNGPAQEAVIREALANAGLLPADISYVEAHGTGTPLGDPIELQALAAAYGTAEHRLAVGSVKTNLGHLEAAAGVAGLLKLLLMFQHEAIPPHVHLAERTAQVDWEALPIDVPTLLTPWPRALERPRRAGLSAFGFSGTNVHLVVEEPPPPATISSSPAGEQELLCLSAKSEAALRELLSLYDAYLAETPEAWADICYTAAVGRTHYPYRLAILARDRDEARAALATATVPHVPAAPKRLALLFTEPAAEGFGEQPGLAPAAVLGIGPGELGAATAAGILTRDDAVRLAQDPNAPVTFSAPQLLFFSSLTGRREDQFVQTPMYWRRQAQQPGSLAAAEQALQAAGEFVVIRQGTPPSEILRELYVHGGPIDFGALYRVSSTRRKVALPAYPFQRQRHWVGASAGEQRAAYAQTLWSEAFAAGQRQSETGPLGWDVRSYPAKLDAMARFTTARITNVLVEVGAFSTAGEGYTVDELMTRFGFLAAHRQLVGRWLASLDEVLAKEGERFVSREPLRPVDLAPIWERLQELLADDPPPLEYLRQCSDKLLPVITGRESALETIFPGGSFDLAESLYIHSLEARYLNPIAAAAVRSAARLTASRHDVRVLEIGAGTGGTAQALLPVLPADKTEYWYTDVSDQFLARAQRKLAAAYPFVRYARLDLNQPLAEQGFGGAGARRFDVIVAANSVHVAHHLPAALSALRELLVPGGLLVLIEATAHHRWFDITTGLLEGWQQFADEVREDNPLLPADRWVTLLQEAGFAQAARLPQAGSLAEALGQHVLLAQSPVSVGAQPAGTAVVAAPPVLAPMVAQEAGSALSFDALRVPVAERRAQLLTWVQGCVRRTMQLANDPGPRDRLSDLGMDSLLALELRTELARGLGLEGRISSTIAFDTGTVEELVRTLMPLVFDDVQEAPPAAQEKSAINAASIANLSDEEVEVLLKQRLGLG